MADTYQVIITKAAKRDIENILDYLLEEESYNVAVTTQHNVMETIYNLANMPSAHSPVQEVAMLTKEIIFRQVVAKKLYRIIYRIKEIKQDVVILRIMHVKRGPDFVKKALL